MLFNQLFTTGAYSFFLNSKSQIEVCHSTSPTHGRLFLQLSHPPFVKQCKTFLVLFLLCHIVVLTMPVSCSLHCGAMLRCAVLCCAVLWVAWHRVADCVLNRTETYYVKFLVFSSITDLYRGSAGRPNYTVQYLHWTTFHESHLSLGTTVPLHQTSDFDQRTQWSFSAWSPKPTRNFSQFRLPQSSTRFLEASNCQCTAVTMIEAQPANAIPTYGSRLSYVQLPGVLKHLPSSYSTDYSNIFETNCIPAIPTFITSHLSYFPSLNSNTQILPCTNRFRFEQQRFPWNKNQPVITPSVFVTIFENAKSQLNFFSFYFSSSKQCVVAINHNVYVLYCKITITVHTHMLTTHTHCV